MKLVMSNKMSHPLISVNASFQSIENPFCYPVLNKDPPAADVDSTHPKRKRCSICEYSLDKKTSTQCFNCSSFVCKEHSVKRIFCITCSK